MTDAIASDILREILQRSRAARGFAEPGESPKERERYAHIAKQERDFAAPSRWTWDNFDASASPKVADAMAAMREGKRFSLLLHGETNSGKSHAVCAMARYLAGEIADPSVPEDFQRYMTIFRMKEPEFAPLWDTQRYRRNEEFEAIVERAKKADVLVYEDMGKVEISKNGYAFTPFGCVVFSIFDERAEARKINLVTSVYEDFEALQYAVGIDTIRRVVQKEADKCRAFVIKMGARE